MSEKPDGYDMEGEGLGRRKEIKTKYIFSWIYLMTLLREKKLFYFKVYLIAFSSSSFPA